MNSYKNTNKMKKFFLNLLFYIKNKYSLYILFLQEAQLFQNKF